MRLREMPRELLLTTLAMIVANIAGAMFFSLLPLYLEDLGASVREVGTFFTLQVILALLSRILGGWVSDHSGRLPTIAVGGMAGMVGYVIFTVAPSWQLVVGGALFGEISASLVGPSFQAFTAEHAPQGKTSSTFGLVQGLFLTCMVIGPVLGGFIADQFGFRTLLITATSVYAVAAVMRVWLARRERFSLRELRSAELRRDLRGLLTLLFAGGLLTWLFIVDGMIDASERMAIPFAPKYITEIGGLSKTAWGGLMALMNLVSAVMMWPGGMLADRIGERRAIALGLVCSGSAWGLLALTHQPALFVVVVIIGGLAGALIGPAFSALISHAVPRESLGITWGVFMTALGVIAIPAPYLGGLIYTQLAPELTFAVASVCALAAIPLALRFLHRTPPAPTDVAQPPAESAMIPGR